MNSSTMVEALGKKQHDMIKHLTSLATSLFATTG
ncbi:hypothetical protein L915_09591 [Phytophthora nicotianae]|uniref:Uncharacterized protein n=1 Tax=Phytophthora nicotianae TaxID=4792 RepID=W2GTP0_PHYNI|nr:hypothetical protein L915_09591 [Phytophthora nicotianae]ETL24157.1 hypothetical protein L916_21831 [Phytophthora nicotianae]ETM45519.1 hypothetical protein L914_09456 [Phytophthora nicotianae]